jgi:DNA mismatch endonuclease (patch repair protein)
MDKVLRATLPNGEFGNVSPLRSRLMARIRSKGNKSTELLLRLALVRKGLSGWKMHLRNIPGCPDFYFRRERVAIFVDGCFWHGCKRCGHIPKTRQLFWRTKFKRNRLRARAVKRALSLAGITVVRFWEHEIQCSSDRVAERIARCF